MISTPAHLPEHTPAHPPAHPSAHDSIPTANYPDWKAPGGDGQRLVWPGPSQILQDTHDNAERLSQAHDVLIQNVPLPALRGRMRAWMGHVDPQQPLIATGHQAELYHPGVWVKNALIDAIAQKLGGAAYHISVDTDAPKHLLLRWPCGSRPITDDEQINTATWAGLLSGPSPAHARGMNTMLQRVASDWSFKPVAMDFLATLQRLGMDQPRLPEALTHAAHQLDWELGLTHHAAMLSPLCASEAYLVFVHHVMARAGEFAADYNLALAEYRAAHHITSQTRPMPNLQQDLDICETPFWCDALIDGRRQRAQVQRTLGGQWKMDAGNGDDQFIFDPKLDGWEAATALGNFLRRHQLRLAPRALTLTTLLRLLLADQFVHGIGGGRYDQVTDRLMMRHFKLQPPRFAVTTATLYFPTAIEERRVNLRPLLQEGRRLRHGLLNRQKHDLVQQIATLPRQSRQRAELYVQMHKLLAGETNTPAMQLWDQQFRTAQDENLRQTALFDRELFYALQPADRLRGIIEAYRGDFA